MTEKIIDGIKYRLNEETKTAEVINKSDGYEGDIIIPATVVFDEYTYRVANIRQRAFEGCSALTTIVIPENVKNIGHSAFSSCSSLTSGIISESVTSIGSRAFFGCSSLTSIFIPKSVIKIAEAAFAGCTSLTSIIVEEGNPIYDSRDNCNAIIETATNTLIKGCSSPTSITIPSSVTSIGHFAFSRCSLLTNVFIPKNVTNIGEAAFAGCTSLTSIIVEEGNPIYDSRDNCNAIIETATNTLIQSCSSPTSITIPNSVKSIGAEAFRFCESLTDITIPASVRSIEGCAFDWCEKLNSITFQGTIAQWKEIALDENWKDKVPTKVVHCTDGDVEI